MIKEPEPKNMTPRRFGRTRRPTKFYQPSLDYVNYTNTGKPSSYEETLAATDVKTWLPAMKSKMDSIHHNQTWELIQLPTKRKSVPCKWVFRYKYVSDSDKSKYKARLFLKGFKQEHWVDNVENQAQTSLVCEHTLESV